MEVRHPPEAYSRLHEVDWCYWVALNRNLVSCVILRVVLDQGLARHSLHMTVIPTLS